MTNPISYYKFSEQFSYTQKAASDVAKTWENIKPMTSLGQSLTYLGHAASLVGQACKTAFVAVGEFFAAVGKVTIGNLVIWATRPSETPAQEQLWMEQL